MPDRPIRLIVFRPEGKACFYAEWTDPHSGRKRRRSTGHEKRREAERWATRLEGELTAGVDHPNRRMTWKAFCERVERDMLPEKRAASRVSYRSAMRAVTEIVNPLLVSAVDADALDKLKAGLRVKGAKGKPVREATVASYLRMLRAMLRWGHRRRLIHALPVFEMPKGTKIAGGRPGRSPTTSSPPCWPPSRRWSERRRPTAGGICSAD